MVCEAGIPLFQLWGVSIFVFVVFAVVAMAFEGAVGDTDFAEHAVAV